MLLLTIAGQSPLIAEQRKSVPGGSSVLAINLPMSHNQTLVDCFFPVSLQHLLRRSNMGQCKQFFKGKHLEMDNAKAAAFAERRTHPVP